MKGREERQNECSNGPCKRQETGHYYAGARFYNPALARWTAVDPLAAQYPGFSPYNYVMGNPLSLVDPTGECPEPAADNTVCISFFIQQDKVIFDHHGDDRSFSSSSDESQSRFWLHVNLDTQDVTIQVNPSCNDDGCAGASPNNNIEVSFREGGFDVTVQAYNSLLDIEMGGRSVSLAPPVRANMSFEIDSDGNVSGSGTRKYFPSAEAYHWRDGNPQTLFQRPEQGGRRGSACLAPIVPHEQFYFPSGVSYPRIRNVIPLAANSIR